MQAFFLRFFNFFLKIFLFSSGSPFPFLFEKKTGKKPPPGSPYGSPKGGFYIHNGFTSNFIPYMHMLTHYAPGAHTHREQRDFKNRNEITSLFLPVPHTA